MGYYSRRWCGMLWVPMTSDDINEGMRTTILVARRLRQVLGRIPSPLEIQWRTATQFQARNPQRGMPPLPRREAMDLALQMMDVVRTASQPST